jgi:hypothetical protein
MLSISTSKETLNPRKGVLRLKHTPIGLTFIIGCCWVIWKVQ